MIRDMLIKPTDWTQTESGRPPSTYYEIAFLAAKPIAWIAVEQLTNVTSLGAWRFRTPDYFSGEYATADEAKQAAAEYCATL